MKISEASKRAGLTIDTLRFYEKEGLITPARSSGLRVYTDADLDELDSIARLRRLGISIPEIRSLLAIDRSIGDLISLTPETMARIRDVQAILDAHSTRLENQIGEMQTTLAAFQAMTSKLTTLLESGGLKNESR